MIASACAIGLSAMLTPAALAESSSDASDSPTSKPQHYIAPAASSATQPASAPVLSFSAEVLDFYTPIGTSDGAATVVEGEDATTTTLSSDVNFEVDSAELTDRAHEILDEMIEEWEEDPPSRLVITGHTDSVDDDAHNQTLSEQRAGAVKDYIDSKLPGLTITAEGKGESEPIASETNEDGSVSE
ncbi:MAG: OmpA family protein, partial [Actinomycetaceae bacterium]|nr:OmpA family protein [Actinomycetaceae bacterium]